MTDSALATRVDVGALPLWKGVQDKPGTIPLPFAFAREGGLVRLSVDPKILESVTKHYGEDDYSFITSPPGTSAWGNELGDLYFSLLSKNLGPLGGKSVLEIGSGTSYIAERVIRELGARRLVACDPALAAAKTAPGIEIAREYFTGSSFPGEAFDAVLSINNLEHIPDPFAYLHRVRALLERNGGAFFVVVPDCERSLRTGDVGVCLHEHLSYFTEASLRFVLGRCGLKPDSLHKQDDTLFAVARPSMVDSSAPEPDSLLGEFKTRMTANLDHARKRIERCRSEGSVGIHGCSVGLNNILHLLGAKHLSGIELFDGDSNKVGRFLGAFDRPILSSSDARYPSLRSLIVSAPTFHTAIARFAAGRGIPSDRIFPLTPL